MKIVRALLSLLSLVACAVCLNLLMRSYLVADRFTCSYEWIASGIERHTTVEISTVRGSMVISVLRSAAMAGRRQARGWWFRHGDELPRRSGTALGPGWRRFRLEIKRDGFVATAPLWLATVLLALLPAGRRGKAWLARRRAARQGLCRVCGYDLRASRDRCPECGTPIPPVEGAGRAAVES